MSEGDQYQVGDVVNGHRWTGVTWERVVPAAGPPPGPPPAAEPDKRPWYTRKWVVALSVVGVLALIGAVVGDSEGTATTDETQGLGQPSVSPSEDADPVLANGVFGDSFEIETERGMKYRIEFTVGRPTVQVKEVSPKDAELTAEMEAQFKVTNLTQAFAADFDLNELDMDVFFVPATGSALLDEEAGELGPRFHIFADTCGGLLSGLGRTVGSDFGESAECVVTLDLFKATLLPEVVPTADAKALKASIESGEVQGVWVDDNSKNSAFDYPLFFAQLREAGPLQDSDSLARDSLTCGHMYARTPTGAPFCP